MTTRKKIALTLVIGPTAVFVAIMVLYAISNAITTLTGAGTNGDMFGEHGALPVVSQVVNVILFIFGSIAALSWLPAMITGIVLLATTPQKKP